MRWNLRLEVAVGRSSRVRAALVTLALAVVGVASLQILSQQGSPSASRRAVIPDSPIAPAVLRRPPPPLRPMPHPARVLTAPQLRPRRRPRRRPVWLAARPARLTTASLPPRTQHSSSPRLVCSPMMEATRPPSRSSTQARCTARSPSTQTAASHTPRTRTSPALRVLLPGQ
jgi:hypothetical protein